MNQKDKRDERIDGLKESLLNYLTQKYRSFFSGIIDDVTDYVKNMSDSDIDSLTTLIPKSIEDKKYSKDSEHDSKIILHVAVIFKCSDNIADKYLTEISDMSDEVVAAITMKYVKKRRITADFNHHDLWHVLHEAGLYHSRVRNWNAQLKKFAYER